MAGSARSKLQQHSRASLHEGRNPPDQPAATGSPADLTGPAAEAPTGLVSSGIRALGTSIAWLSGSVVGVSAIFYAFGYLITLANLHLLGFDLLAFQYDSTFYIARGANFLMMSVIQIGQFWLVVFMALALAHLASQLAPVRALIATLWTMRPFRSFARHRDIWQALGYLMLLVLLGLQLQAHLSAPQDLTVSGVLYPQAESSAGESPIRKWILDGNVASLHQRYADFLQQQFWIGVLLLAACGLTRGWRGRVLLATPFAAVFAISLVWLPLEYGKLELLNKFPKALIHFEHSAETAGQPPVTMYLLNKSDSAFVLWDAERRQIVWTPNRTVVSAEISANQTTLSQIIKTSGAAGR